MECAKRATILALTSVSALLFGPVLVVGQNISLTSSGSFYRPSTAYLFDRSTHNLQIYDPDTPRTQQALGCSGSTGGRIHQEPLRGGGYKDMKAWVVTKAGLFAIGTESVTFTEKKIYCSSDGFTDWYNPVTKIDGQSANSFPNQVFGFSLLHNDRLLVYIRHTGGFAGYISDDGGSQWVKCVDVDHPSESPLFGLNISAWQLAKRDTAPEDTAQGAWGTICYATRNGTGINNTIWRSTDNGATWKQVLCLTDVTHFHRISYLSGLRRWIADTGDSTDHEREYCSDDDGLSWHTYAVGGTGAPAASPISRITGMYDYGHPTRIAIASDQIWRVGYLDLQDWTYGLLGDFPATHYRSVGFQVGHYYSDFFNYHGLTYACSFTLLPADHLAKAKYLQDHVFVTSDMEHWTLYWRRPDPSSGDAHEFTHFAGVIGNTLHLGCSTGAHYAIPLAQARLAQGTILSPEKTNYLTSDVADGNTLSGWGTTPQGTLSLYNAATAAANGAVFDRSNVLLGSSSLHLTYSGAPEALCSIWHAVSGCTDKPMVAHCWVKLVKGSGVVIGSTAQTNLPAEIGQWTEVWGYPDLTTAGTTSRFLYTGGTTDRVTGQLDMYIDAMELIDAPLADGYRPGRGAAGNLQAAESITSTENLGASWTHLFGAKLLGSSLDLADSLDYLRSYISGNNILSIYGHNRLISKYTDYVVLQDPPAGVISATPFQYAYVYSPQATLDNAFSAADVGRGISFIPGSGKTTPLGWYFIAGVTPADVIINGQTQRQVVLTLNMDIARAPVDHATGTVFEYVFGMAGWDAASLQPLPGSPVESKDHWFHRGTNLITAVRCDNGAIRLSVSDGQIEHVAGQLNVPIAGQVTITTGSGGVGEPLGSKVMPMMLLQDRILNVALSESQVEESFAQASVDAALTITPDHDGDGDVDEDDMTLFMDCFGAAGVERSISCASKDLDGDLDIDMDDFGLQQRCYSGSGVGFDPQCLQP